MDKEEFKHLLPDYELIGKEVLKQEEYAIINNDLFTLKFYY